MVNHTYTLRYDTHAYNAVDPRSLRLNVYELATGEFINLNLHLRQWRTVDEQGRPLYHVNVADAVRPAVETVQLVRPGENWWRDLPAPRRPFLSSTIRLVDRGRVEVAPTTTRRHSLPIARPDAALLCLCV